MYEYSPGSKGYMFNKRTCSKKTKNITNIINSKKGSIECLSLQLIAYEYGMCIVFNNNVHVISNTFPHAPFWFLQSPSPFEFPYQCHV